MFIKKTFYLNYNSSYVIDITVQTTGTNSNISFTTVTSQIVNSTISTTTQATITTTTTVAIGYVIDTGLLISLISDMNLFFLVITVPLNFTTYDNASQQLILTGLRNVINLGFICLTNPSFANCTQVRQRLKRQCSSGYDVNLVSNITEVN